MLKKIFFALCVCSFSLGAYASTSFEELKNNISEKEILIFIDSAEDLSETERVEILEILSTYKENKEALESLGVAMGHCDSVQEKSQTLRIFSKVFGDVISKDWAEDYDLFLGHEIADDLLENENKAIEFLKVFKKLDVYDFISLYGTWKNNQQYAYFGSFQNMIIGFTLGSPSSFEDIKEHFNSAGQDYEIFLEELKVQVSDVINSISQENIEIESIEYREGKPCRMVV